MFSCWFWEIFKNTIFTEHLWTTSSGSCIKLNPHRRFWHFEKLFQSILPSENPWGSEKVSPDRFQLFRFKLILSFSAFMFRNKKFLAHGTICMIWFVWFLFGFKISSYKFEEIELILSFKNRIIQVLMRKVVTFSQLHVQISRTYKSSHTYRSV